MIRGVFRTLSKTYGFLEAVSFQETLSEIFDRVLNTTQTIVFNGFEVFVNFHLQLYFNLII